jgi:hypothetical protein
LAQGGRWNPADSVREQHLHDLLQCEPQQGAKAFLRYLLRPEQLGPFLEAAQGRFFPPMPKLLERPFWHSGNDPHVAVLARQLAGSDKRFWPSTYNWEYQEAEVGRVWPRAVMRIVMDDWTAEAAVDEAIAQQADHERVDAEPPRTHAARVRPAISRRRDDAPSARRALCSSRRS